jgi:arsenate reductase
MKYRELKLKDKLPLMTDQEMIEILASDGMLVKRPVFIFEDQVLVGYRQGDYDKLKPGG